MSVLAVVHRRFSKAELASVEALAVTAVPAHAALSLSARDRQNVVVYIRSRAGLTGARAVANGCQSN